MTSDIFIAGRTLFYPAPGPNAILVSTRKGRKRSKPMRFAGPHQALTWAIAHHAGFVYFHTPDPAHN
jgi:hypothetical protein